MRKRWGVSAGLAGVFAVLMTVTSFAAVTEQQAIDAAGEAVPAGSEYLDARSGDGVYEIRYFHRERGEKYEVSVDRGTGALLTFESESFQSHGTDAVRLTEEQAEAKVTDEIDGAQIRSVYLDSDDGKEYDVAFRTGSLYGKYTIHAENGTILERDICMGIVRAEEGDKSGLLSREEVKQLAERQVGGGAVSDLDLDWTGGSYVYEVEVYKDRTEYDLVFRADTGELLRMESETDEWDFMEPERGTAAAMPAESTGADRKYGWDDGDDDDKSDRDDGDDDGPDRDDGDDDGPDRDDDDDDEADRDGDD